MNATNSENTAGNAPAFTPGPWRVESGWKIVYDGPAPDREIIARVENCYIANNARCYGPAETAANARLIAAAPDMLEALQAIQALLTPKATHCHHTIACAIATATGQA